MHEQAGKLRAAAPLDHSPQKSQKVYIFHFGPQLQKQQMEFSSMPVARVANGTIEKRKMKFST